MEQTHSWKRGEWLSRPWLIRFAQESDYTSQQPPPRCLPCLHVRPPRNEGHAPPTAAAPLCCFYSFTSGPIGAFECNHSASCSNLFMLQTESPPSSLATGGGGGPCLCVSTRVIMERSVCVCVCVYVCVWKMTDGIGWRWSGDDKSIKCAQEISANECDSRARDPLSCDSVLRVGVHTYVFWPDWTRWEERCICFLLREGIKNDWSSKWVDIQDREKLKTSWPRPRACTGTETGPRPWGVETESRPRPSVYWHRNQDFEVVETESRPGVCTETETGPKLWGVEIESRPRPSVYWDRDQDLEGLRPSQDEECIFRPRLDQDFEGVETESRPRSSPRLHDRHIG